MYSLVEAVVLNEDTGTFGVEDVGDMPLLEFLKAYQVGYLVLTNEVSPDELFLTIEVLNQTDKTITDPATSVTRWVASFKGVLKTTLIEPLYNFTKLRYADIHQAGYVKKAVHPRSTIEGYPAADLTDLYVSKEGITSDTLNENSLFTINGYLHNHSVYKEGVKISDGVGSFYHSNSNQSGVISTAMVGGSTRVNITPEMIGRNTSALSLVDETVINIGLDLRDKSIILSFAGMMIPASGMLTLSDPANGVLVFNPNMLDLAPIIHQASKFIHIPELDYVNKDARLAPLSLSKLRDDSFMMALYRLSQTFIIVINKPYMMFRSEALPYQGVVGRYEAASHDNELIVDALGVMVPYLYRTAGSLPWLSKRHIYNVPKNRCEYTNKAIESAPYRSNDSYNGESLTYRSVANKLTKLSIEFAEEVKTP